jgi:Fe-S-cluster containining protein
LRAKEPTAREGDGLGKLAPWLVPLGRFRHHPLTGTPLAKELFFWHCRALGADGNCGIYGDRPELCRRYPYGHRCEHGEHCQWDAAREGRADKGGSEMATAKQQEVELKAPTGEPSGERLLLEEIAAALPSRGCTTYDGEDPYRLIVCHRGGLFSVVAERIGRVSRKARAKRRP